MSNKARTNRYSSIFESKLNSFHEEIKFHLKSLDQASKLISKYEADAQASLVAREKTNAQLTISKLKSILEEFEQLQLPIDDSVLKSKHEQRVRLIKSEASNAINRFNKTHSCEANHPSSETIDQQNIPSASVQQESLQLQAASLSESKQKLKQIESLNQDIEELNEIATKFSELVEEQKTTVNNIEQNITETEENVKVGTKSLIKASASSVVPLTCAAISGAVLGPIGAIITFKVSAGIMTALGASVAAYTGSKYVQNKKRIESEKELEDMGKK